MKRTAWTALILFAASASAFGQPEPGGTVTITSRPPGCTVYLSGELELVTTAPVTLQEPLQGMYVVHAMRPGYETWKGVITFGPGAAPPLNIELRAKTRLRAGMRSLFVPGWGQYYAGEKGRSALWGVLTVASEVGGIVYESRYRDRKRDWEDSRARFDTAATLAEKEAARAEALRLHQRAYDAETDRRWAWGIVAGVWALNLVDALVFFPGEERFSHMPLTIGATPDRAGAALMLTIAH